MFRCDRKRADWYLTRNLANTVQVEPLIIQLNFEPKGLGHRNEPYYLTEKSNLCVVCGSTSDLTRHHAVPYCYRKHFPMQFKSRYSHDVVPLCVPCHESYERPAFELKKQLAVEYGIPIDGQEAKESDLLIKAKKAALALTEHGDKIPLDRQAILRTWIADYFGRDVTDSDVKIVYDSIERKSSTRRHTLNYGRMVVEKLDDIPAFMRMWRQHFVDTMQPQYLFDHWDVNHRLKREQIETGETQECNP
jgi:hypothetical protein